jgi:hypothetical protein
MSFSELVSFHENKNSKNKRPSRIKKFPLKNVYQAAIETFFNKHGQFLLDSYVFDCIPSILRLFAFSMSYLLWALKFRSMNFFENQSISLCDLIGKYIIPSSSPSRSMSFNPLYILIDKTIGINVMREKAARDYPQYITTRECDDINELERKVQFSMNLTTTMAISESVKTLAYIIPAHWSVFELSIDIDANTLFVVRISNGELYSLCLPLHRAIIIDQHQTAKLWFDRLNELLHKSHESTRNLDSYMTKQKKIEWWNARNSLDVEMNKLIHEIEDTWLGAFKVRIFFI